MPSQIVELFAPYFAKLTDPRMERTKRHELLEIIVVALMATVAGANGWADIERFGNAKIDFFRNFLKLPNGIPSHDTFGRVFARLDPAALLTCIQAWLKAFRQTVDKELVAIDGKTLRGSFDTAAGQNPLHLVSAWATEARLVLGQVAVDAKSNEITAIPVLLELLDLKGCIVTVDAMGCQKEIAAAIRAREADYVLAVKDNQPNLHQAIHDAFVAYGEDDFTDPSLRHHKTVDRDHGRHETREYFSAPVPKDLVGLIEWKDLRSIGVAIRRRVLNGKESTEVLLHQQPDAQSEDFCQGSAWALGHRESSTLESGCNFFRGSESSPQGSWPSEPWHASPLSTVDFAAGHFLERKPTRETSARWLE
jgi:predicted transposase YbfD/YdcC